MLEYLGYKVTVKTSSLEALRLFREKPGNFDLVITDHTMPGMVGVDLAREMKDIRPDIPIILCSGYSDVINPEKAKGVGIQRVVLKPLDLNAIAETVRVVLEKRAWMGK